MSSGRWLKHILLIVVGTSVASVQTPANADGWHSPVLSTGSVNQWLGDAVAMFPKKGADIAVADFSEVSGNSSLRAGRGIEDLKTRAPSSSNKAASPSKKTSSKQTPPSPAANLLAKLNPQQKAFLSQKANDALQVLAFMKQGNVIPQEFPRFPIQQMDQFRGAAKQLLHVTGPAGTQAVVGQLRSHLMSGLRSASDVTYHPEYVQDMLDVLATSAAAGWLTSDDLTSLQEAMGGQKAGETQQLADQVRAALPKDLDFLTLMEWANGLKDNQRKQEVLDILRQRVPYVELTELEQALSIPGLDRKTEAEIASHLKNALVELGVSGLLKLLSIGSEDLQVEVEKELRTRKPTYSEIQSEISTLRDIANGEHSRAVAYANWHLANAFQRAPMAHCLYWLGIGDDKLDDLIWKQVDGRLRRADAQRRRDYSNTAMKAVALKDLDHPTKAASLQLLGKLKDRAVVKELNEQLLSMPRELWPEAGKALRAITGADYGPNVGDGVAEVSVAVKQWREWAERNGQ